MANPGLHENGSTCPACELRREEVNLTIGGTVNVPCNTCGGTGRIPTGEANIVSRSVSWAREHYWPARERAFAAHNAKT